MRLHLVDGTFELFRAHFSKRPARLSPDGRDVKATHGLAESMRALLRDPTEAVTHVAVAFDNPIRSFRNDLFAGYKTEEGVPAELLAQFDGAEEAVRALGMTVWSMRDFEADDALATAAARFQDQVEQVRILTPDKDLGQCISGRRVVQVDRIAGVTVGTRFFGEHKGPPLDRYRARHLFFQSGSERDVSVRFTGEGALLALEQWPERATRNPDGSVTVVARLSPGNYLLGWVLGYGGQAEVAGPPDVRDEMRSRVEDLARMYAR